LAPQNAPLQNREFVGCEYGGTFWGKKAVEGYHGGSFTRCFMDATVAQLEVGTNDYTVSSLVRLPSIWTDPGTTYQEIAGKRNLGGGGGLPGWHLLWANAGNDIVFYMGDAAGFTLYTFANVIVADGALHLITVSVDRNGNVSLYIDDAATVAQAALRPGNADTAFGYHILGDTPTAGGCVMQMGWHWYIVGVAATRVGHDNLWRHARLHVPFLYARTNPLTVPISSGRVATFAGGNVGQTAVGYHPSLVSAPLGNGLGTGYVAEDGQAAFLGFGSNNPGTWTYGVAGGSPAVVDGPDGTRSAIRAVDASGVAAEYVQTAKAIIPATVAGDWYTFGFLAQQGGVGSTCLVTAYFDTGGVAEEITVLAMAGTVPAGWTNWGGAGGGVCYWGSIQAVQAGNTRVQVRMYPTDGVILSQGTIDFAEVRGLAGQILPLTSRRCAAGATSPTTTPSILVVNTRNYIYNPLRGRQQIVVGDFQGTSGAVFLGFGLAGTAGSLMLSYNAGQLVYRVWDGAAGLVAAVNCGAVNTSRHVFDVVWDSMIGYMAVVEAGTVLGSFTGPWVPGVADVTPLGYGCDNAGGNAARCFIEVA
jgi:hypothetical protein